DVVQEFRDQDVVADRQGRHHGAGGDLEGLDDEGPDEEGQDDGDEDGLAVLAPKGLAADGLGPFPFGGGRDDRRRLDRRDGYSVTFSRARKASCGTSTRPTCFILFLPSFCFSHSFLLRVMSPPWHFAVTFLRMAPTVSRPPLLLPLAPRVATSNIRRGVGAVLVPPARRRRP